MEDGIIPVKARGKEIVTLRARLEPTNLIGDFNRHTARILPQLMPGSPLENGEAGKLPRLLTEDEVVAEEQRAEQLGLALQAIRSEVSFMQAQIDRQAPSSMAQLALLHRLKGREATLARQYDEAQISALLNRQLLVTRQVEKGLTRIGESLNWARTRKRVSEFFEPLLRRTGLDFYGYGPVDCFHRY